jgi:hypothetical protein
MKGEELYYGKTSGAKTKEYLYDIYSRREAQQEEVDDCLVAVKYQ